MTRCVRSAPLLGLGDHNRKEWLEYRLEELSAFFAVAVRGFLVIRNVDLIPETANVGPAATGQLDRANSLYVGSRGTLRGFPVCKKTFHFYCILSLAARRFDATGQLLISRVFRNCRRY
jgi:hypothetical protein